METHSRIPDVDSNQLHVDLSLRRMGTMFLIDSIQTAFYKNKALYYETEQEKYRLKANKMHYRYEKVFALYLRQQDSLDNSIYQ